MQVDTVHIIIFPTAVVAIQQTEFIVAISSLPTVARITVLEDVPMIQTGVVLDAGVQRNVVAAATPSTMYAVIVTAMVRGVPAVTVTMLVFGKALIVEK